MLTRHLAVFAKAPVLGLVKRRLGQGIGAVEATRFYHATLASLLRRVGRDRRWRTTIWVTPDNAARVCGWWPPALRRRPQGPGDLGQRMARALRAPPQGLPPGPVVLIGSDIPAVNRGHVASAFAALGDHDAVFGPATDGGYWLIGLRRRPCRELPLHAVRWSSRHALADTLTALGPARVALIDRLADVDDAAAYRALLRAR
jgi:rSAM/selenodomain-associated transferase 1